MLKYLLAIRNIAHCVLYKYFDILNRLGVDYQCDGRTDRQNYDNNKNAH